MTSGWTEVAYLARVDGRFAGEADLYAAVERVIAPLGLRVDRSSPMVDGRLIDGSRIHVVVPPAAVDGPIVAIRRFTQAVSSLGELVTVGTATREQVELLSKAVAERRDRDRVRRNRRRQDHAPRSPRRPDPSRREGGDHRRCRRAPHPGPPGASRGPPTKPGGDRRDHHPPPAAIGAPPPPGSDHRRGGAGP